MAPHEVTTDAVLSGRISLRQPRRGYRVNVDALLLAAFAAEGRIAPLAVDLGAGVGAVGLVLAAVGAARAVALVDADPDSVMLARQNLADNATRGEAHLCELGRQRIPSELVGRAELVVSNPPFFTPTGGTPARHTGARRARSGALEPFVRAAQAALSGPRARAAFCYPAATLPELFRAADGAGLVPKRLRLVQARATSTARLALVELRRARPGGLVVLPPLVEWNGRARSPELEAIVAGHFGPAR